MNDETSAAMDTSVAGTTTHRESQPMLTSILSKTSRGSFMLLDVARQWPCHNCGILLALLHLFLGATLIVFDVATNSHSSTPVAVSTGLTALVCSLFVAIASRRLDRAVLYLLGFFSLLSSLLCLALFVSSSVVLNKDCHPETDCLSVTAYSVHCALIALALAEFALCCITLLVTYRSLRNAFGVAEPGSPYSTLIIGDYRSLKRRPLMTKDAAERSMHESWMTRSGISSI